MLDTLSEPTIVAWIGLAGGVVLGLAARIGRFCTLGALEDLFYGDSPGATGLKLQTNCPADRHRSSVRP